MSTTTPYLGLTLYDSSGDQSVTFATFRAVWGGTATTSNFYKIDTFASTTNTRLTTLEGFQPPITVSALFISSNFYQATGVSSITAYNTGMTIILSVDTTSSGTVTLDINSLGTKSVMKVDSTGTAINLTGSDLVKGRKYLFQYDGTRWLWVSANSADQIQIVGTSGNIVTVGSTNNLVGTTTPAALVADATHAATGKTTPVGADEMMIADSAASFAIKKVLLSNLYKALGTGTPSAQTALLGDGSWGAVGSSFWTAMAGTPIRVSNTTFTVTGDITSASPIAKGMVIKWTESSTIRVAMVSIPPTYSAPNSTITIVGDTMTSIDASSLKYASIDATKILLSKAGTIGAVETDTFPAWYAEEPYRVLAADCYVGAAGTTNSTTFDINKNGTTMFTTKPTLATTVAASPTPFTADNGTSLALNDKVTADVDAVQTTNAVDAYLKLYLFPTRYLYLS